MTIPAERSRLKGYRSPAKSSLMLSGSTTGLQQISGTSEVIVPINGVKIWLWRAVYGSGDVLDILVQPRRNAKAAKRFLKQLIARFGQPRVIITDKLRSYVKPIRQLAPDADYRAHKGINNRIEGSHRPTRKREKLMGRFKSPR